MTESSSVASLLRILRTRLEGVSPFVETESPDAVIAEIERLVTQTPVVSTTAADLRRAIVALFAGGRRETEKAAALAALDRFAAAVNAAGPNDIAKILRAD